jgi:hypothetical protein
MRLKFQHFNRTPGLNDSFSSFLSFLPFPPFLDGPHRPMDTALRDERNRTAQARQPLVVAPLLGVGPAALVSFRRISGPISAQYRGMGFLLSVPRVPRQRSRR